MKMQLNSFLRIRYEVLFIYWFSFFFINIWEILFNQNIQILEKKDIWLLILLNLFLSFLFSFIIESIYIFSKLISAILLRLRQIWKYAIPSILVFFLLVFPLFDLTELKFSFHQLEGVRGSIFLSIYGAIMLVSIILIFIFPLFYDLNGGFIIISSILSYIILKTIIFSYYTSYPIYYFLIFYYLFILLFYFFFQLRRRFSINVLYEKYYYPLWFILINVVLLLLFIYLKFINYDSFLYSILYTLLSYLAFINLCISLSINIETHYNKNIVISNYIFIVLLVIHILSGLFLYYNINKFQFSNVQKTKYLTSFYLLEIIHFLNDKDFDGENSIFGNDPDNLNLNIRSEGKFHLENETIYIDKLPDNNFDYYFISLNFDKENPDVTNSFLSASNNTPITLFSLLNQQSSYESYLIISNIINKKYKSIFTNLTENYYRTICIGYDANQNYFSTNAKIRLDKGCEIFLSFNDENDTKGVVQNDNTIEHYKTFLDYSRKQFLAYKTKKNFLWLHYDFSNMNVKENDIKEYFLNEVSSFLQPNKTNIIIVFIFYSKPVPSYKVFINSEYSRSILDPKLAYFSTLFRIIYFLEFQKLQNSNTNIEIPKERTDFFLNQFEFTKTNSIHHFVFIEPQDDYWKELTKIFNKPILPSISIIKKTEKEYLIYDGRFGYYNQNFNPQK